MHAAPPAHQAIILAAGNGDRFHSSPPRSNLLADLDGIPLLIRPLTSAASAGVTDGHLVLGHDADCVRATASAGAPAALTLHFHFNPHWRLENGVSLLMAREYVEARPFALLMGDHIFEPAVLRRLLETP